jgi:hypothetical protein
VTRAYLRLDPGFDERKNAYPDGAYAALVATLCIAESQPQRGRFRSISYLKALLGKRGRWVTYLLEHRDVVVQKDGRVYVDGWDEWQEGDWKVGERVRRIRSRPRGDVTPETVTDVTLATVTNDSVQSESSETIATESPARLDLSDGGRLSAGAGGAGHSAGGDDSDRGHRTARSRAHKAAAPVSKNGAEPGAVTLTKAQLEAWSTFGPEWDQVKAAWLAKGLRLPPAGSPDDDDTSQRGLLYQVLDARPTDLPRWISMAPGGSARKVIDWVLAQWHEVRAEAGDDDTEGWFAGPSRGEAAESLGRIMERLR